eukprot:2056960-Rhodomonas_salina.2
MAGNMAGNMYARRPRSALSGNTNRPQSAVGGTAMGSAMKIDPAARFLAEEIGDHEKDKYAKEMKEMRERQRQVEQNNAANLEALKAKGRGMAFDPNHAPNILDFAAEYVGRSARKATKELSEARQALRDRGREQRAKRAGKEDPDHHEWAMLMAKNSGYASLPFHPCTVDYKTS